MKKVMMIVAAMILMSGCSTLRGAAHVTGNVLKGAGEYSSRQPQQREPINCTKSVVNDDYVCQ